MTTTTAPQRKILSVLSGGPLTTTQVAEAAGWFTAEKSRCGWIPNEVMARAQLGFLYCKGAVNFDGQRWNTEPAAEATGSRPPDPE